MFIKLLAIISLLCQLRVQCQEEKETCVRSEIKTTHLDVIASFQRLKSTIIAFFNVTLAKLETKRRKIKKAFLKFINEVFYNKKPKCSLRLSINDDIESKMSTPELIVYHGYHAETHTTLTSDGYILSLHRIVAASTKSTNVNRKIAILNHGLLGSSIDWILLGPKKALPYLLSDAGYDVWLPNFRGNIYSRAHVTKMTDSADFWNFSWHEIGLFDIPAVIDYIRQTTGGKGEIHFIAYSMSGSALLVLLSSSLRYNAILKSAALLAPLIFMDNVKGPLQFLAEMYTEDNYSTMLSTESPREFNLKKMFNKTSIIKFCKENERSCKNPMLFLSDNGKQISSVRVKAKIYNNVPSGGSAKSIIHYLQVIKNKQFQMFDLGESKNYDKYGKLVPSTYQLKEIKVPIILFNSIYDTLSTVLDISKLKLRIPGVIINHVIDVPDFSHFDFLWAESAPELLYIPLIEELQKYI